MSHELQMRMYVILLTVLLDSHLVFENYKLN